MKEELMVSQKKTNTVMEILEECEYKNVDNTIFAYVQTVNGKEQIQMMSTKFINIIAGRYYKRIGKTVSTAFVKNCISNYQGLLYEDLPRSNVRFRIFMEKDGSAIYVDKGDSEYHYFKITADGWTVETGGDQYFRRSSSQGELPEPSRTGNIKRIFKYCRVPDNLKNVFIAFVTSCFIDIQHPCLVIQGEAGSSKTTLSKMLKMLIDPCVHNEPCIFPNDAAEIKDIYTQMYLAAYDNLDKLNKKQSNFLCSAITGAQLVRRKLFTDSESCTYFLRQPIILNGISGIISKEDLLSRSIVLSLPSIPKEERKSEKALMKEYEKDLPVILGGIFEILSEVLDTFKEDTFKETPRMADFFEYGYYICEAYGKGKEFMEEYLKAITVQEENLSAENSNLQGLIDALLDEDEENCWYGTMGEFWKELREYSLEYDIPMPNGPNWLVRELNECKKYLATCGIVFELSRNSNNCRYIEVTRCKD